MATVITVKKRGQAEGCQSELEKIKLFLPYELCREIEEAGLAFFGGCCGRIEEIRLRSDRRVFLTVGGRQGKRNLLLNTVLSSGELSEILNRMCDGSLYAYGESIIRGYISLGGGVRVGVCGRASVEKGQILGIYNVSALNIRLPCGRVAIERGLVDRIRAGVRRGEGSLIYAPPAQGKTTLLRSLAYSLAGGNEPMRVALVDTREEFEGFFDRVDLALDVLSGYPKAEGIRIATAFMNPQVIICDEISAEEAQAVAEAQNCGVPLIASTHGEDCRGILKRSGIRALHEAGVFGLYVGIRISEAGGFEYRLHGREDISFGDMGNDPYSA